MKRTFAALVFALTPLTVFAQVVAQGPPADTTNVDAWPVKVVFGDAQVDPRAIRALTSGDQVTLANASIAVTGTFWQATQPVSLADNAARLLGQVTFSSPQAVTQSGVWTQRLFDGGGTSISSTANALWGVIRDAAGNARGVNVNASNQLSVSVDNTPSVTISGTVPISAAALPLPTGASTESTLATLNGKVNAASALPGLTDPGTVVRIIPEERVSTGALDHLGAVVNVSVKGFQSWGGSIDVGTCTCTIVSESSNDDGATYVSALVFSDIQQVTQWVMSSPNASVTAEFLPTGKTTNAQLRVSAYTSGSATARMRASVAQTATGVGALSSGIPSLPAPFFRTLIGGADVSGNAQSVTMIDSAPSGTEQGLVTRNIPSGTQTINGTVTANAGTNTSTANLDVALSTRLKPADTLAGVTTVTAVTAITNALPAGSNVIGHVINDSGSTTAVTGNVATTIADGADTTLGAKADAKSTATDTTAITVMQVLKEISAMEQAPASRAVTNAGFFAVQAAATIADGADTTQGAKADAKNTATDTTAVSEMSVLKEISAMEQAPASRAVTNGGTFAVQATLQANSGVDIGKLTANQSTNVAQVAGTTTDTNSGTKSAGTLRVVLATDQPALTNKLLVTPDSVALPANQSVNVSQVAGTTTDTNSGTKSAGTMRVVLATDQPALTNKLLVTPDSVALPANQSVNVNQLAGTTTDTNSGNKSAGTMRVVIATDQPALTNKLLVTPDSVALPANQSVNVSQINGVTTTMGNGASGTGVQRVTIANDSTGTIIATQATPANLQVTATPITLTKGSQGSTGFSVQNLYDAGRSRVSFTADRVTPAASDTLVTFVKNVAGTATTGQTTYTVTNAKTFRVTSIYVGIANTTTVSANVRVTLRENTGGACIASSPAVAMLQVASGAAVANEGANGNMTIPDGWEFPAADSVCISAIGAATTETMTVTVMGYEY